MKIKINPLDELRKEREMLKRECDICEDTLADQWAYLSDNAVSLVFSSITHGIMGKLGFGNKSYRSNDNSGSNGIAQNLLGSITGNWSLIWELVQPLLWAFAVKKIKSIFKKKK